MKKYKNIIQIVLVVCLIICILYECNSMIYGYGAATEGNTGAGTSTGAPPSAAAGQNGSISTDASNPGASGNSDASHTTDEIIGEAQDFLEQGKKEGETINGDNLKTASHTLYNILLSIGVIAAVIIGAYLGVKFMLASAEDKAKVKESLVPYIAGCIIIFGAFTIWKLAINLLGSIDKVGKSSYNIEYRIADKGNLK